MAASIYPALVRNVFGTYAYFVVDEGSGHALLIDPGAQPELLMRAAAERGWTVEKILLTHGHFDHMAAADALRQAWGAPIYAHELSPEYLENPDLNLSARNGRFVTLSGTLPLHDGDVVSLEAAPQVRLHVLHTPGHTDDSVAYVLEGGEAAFVGDDVYEGGPGLTVFPTGNARKLDQSLRTKILPLPDDTVLLTGHSQSIDIGYLKRVMM